MNLVLVADAAHPAAELARTLAAEHRMATRPVTADLAAPDVLVPIAAATRDLDVGLLVYNAAHSVVGRFLDLPLDDKLRTVDVNCRGQLLLTHHFAARMAQRGSGGIILMSSLAAFQGQAMVALYAATKAFALVLGEGLWDELRDHGVDVVAFCPGATRTPNFVATRPRPTGLVSAPVMEPDATVAEALAALGAGPTAIAGRTNRVAAFLLHRLLSRRRLVRFMSRTMRAMYDPSGGGA